MATKYGTNATKIAANPAQLAEQGEQRGRINVHYDEYVFTGDLAVNDVIYMGGKLPAGARVLDVVLDSPDLDTASAGALTSGWLVSDDAVVAADDDGFLTTVDVHTAGKAQSMSALLASNVPGKFKKFASAVQPAIKISGETDATTGTIRQAIYYVVD
jgi:hypothetical protein